MKLLKNFLISFIPKHVSNRIFLKCYQILTLLPVPRKIRNKNYKNNMVQLQNAVWNFLTEPSMFIENQSEWGKILYGAGHHHNMSYSGCEIIATFNALKALMGSGSPKSMANLICEYEAHGSALWGEFGVSSHAIEAYFRKNGFKVTTTDKSDTESLSMVDSQSRVLIATVYNDENDITKMVHTVCITKDIRNRYILHNAYYKDSNGTYVASDSYPNLSEAISHISRYETKLIYLIGIAKKAD